MTSEQRDKLPTSPVNDVTVTPPSTLSATTASIANTSQVALVRDVTFTTDMNNTTNSQPFTAVVSHKSSLSSNNRTSGAYQTSPRSSAPTTTSKLFTEHFLPPSRTTSSDVQTHGSHPWPVTDSTGSRTTSMTTRANTVTSVPPYITNSTPSHSFSDKQLANMTSPMTSDTQVTSQIVITVGNYTTMILNDTSTVIISRSDNEGMST